MAKETRTHEIRCEAVSAAENLRRRQRARSRALRNLARMCPDLYRDLLADAEAAEGVVVLQRGPKPAWMNDPEALEAERRVEANLYEGGNW